MKLVVRTDAIWIGQDSEDQKCFSCVVVRFGDHVIDVVCSKQDVVSLSAPHSKHIFIDLQVMYTEYTSWSVPQHTFSRGHTHCALRGSR